MGRIFEVRKEKMKKTELKKAKLYSRYGKEIFISAKNGGTNLESNRELKHLIERAKKADVPSDVIERNIKKAQGNDAIHYEPVRYEGFGPGGSAVIVDTLTENVNRTVGEVRYCFTKVNQKLGVNGSVEHMYDHLSKIVVDGADEEAVLETLLGREIEPIDIWNTDSGVHIVSGGYELDAMESALRDASYSVLHSESGWYPQTTITLSGEDLENFQKMLEMLNDLDDVQNVYHNVDLDQSA